MKWSGNPKIAKQHLAKIKQIYMNIPQHFHDHVTTQSRQIEFWRTLKAISLYFDGSFCWYCTHML